MSKLKSVLLWTMIALPCPSLFGHVPSRANLQVGHDFWGFKDNAPQETLALAQTSDGFLWVGTTLGLYRFDGTRFELFHSPFGDQLLSTNVYALFAPPSGGLWIGYAFGGFSFLKNGRVTNYDREISSPTGSVYNFAQNAGVLWAATTSGLWKFDHSHWQHIGPEYNVPAGPIFDVRFDQDGTLWALRGVPIPLPGRRSLFYLRAGSGQFQTAANDAGGFTVDADGRLVTSAESKQLLDKSRHDSGDLPFAYPVLRNGSQQIVDRAKSVWILPSEPIVLRVAAWGGAADALNQASPRNSETYNLSSIGFAKLVDREGNIWFGEQNGVHRFFYSPLIRQGLPKNEGAYFTVAADDQGAVWITAGDENPKLFRVANGQVEPRNSQGGFVGFTYRGPDKTLWFGGTNGLWRSVGGSLARVDLPKEMADQSAFLQTITQDHSGGMWVSFGRHGLYRLADGVWTSYGGREDLPKTGVVIEFTDSLRRVWFGYTKSQLAVLNGDHVQVFGPNDGIRVGSITAIYGRGSEIWIGGESGLQQFDHGRFHNIQATDSELLRGISGIVETANGDLWLNGLGGIFHVRRAEIAEALKNSAYPVKGERFGTRKGLPGFPFQLRPLNTAIEGTDGRLWFATSGGVVWLDPARAETNVPPPPITIQSISADDKNYQLGSELKFSAHTSSVQISYAAISLSDPTEVHYRYKLQETDKDWHEAASASPVSYRNLAPGSYHFSVMATDTNGVWSDAVATTEFTILPAFYQTGWFTALCVVSALAFLYMLYMLRVWQLARQFEVRMEERVGERTRIARDLHDTMLQSFQAVLLKLHAMTFVIRDRPAEAEKTLENAIQQARAAVTEGRDAVQGLRSSTLVTNDLASAIRMIVAELADQGDSNSPDFRVDVEGTPRDLAPILRDDVYRIAGEAVRNAFHHAEAARIEVEIRYDPRQLRVRVRDDGKGIDPVVLESGARAGHYGLPGLHERAKRVGGKLTVLSDPGSGTEVELSIPASVVYASASGRHALFGKKSAS
jgi:signal transduction histidine kinase/ligand-binding sensor domain-containing protein